VSLPRYAARRDAVESDLISLAEGIGAVWLKSGPFDGWLWFRDRWHLCEIKDPKKNGWANEFTDDQLKMIIKLNERQIPLNILREEGDVFKLLGARRTA
jgi:hypothetical protein